MEPESSKRKAKQHLPNWKRKQLLLKENLAKHSANGKPKDHLNGQAEIPARIKFLNRVPDEILVTVIKDHFLREGLSEDGQVMRKPFSDLTKETLLKTLKREDLLHFARQSEAEEDALNHTIHNIVTAAQEGTLPLTQIIGDKKKFPEQKSEDWKKLYQAIAKQEDTIAVKNIQTGRTHPVNIVDTQRITPHPTDKIEILTNHLCYEIIPQAVAAAAEIEQDMAGKERHRPSMLK
jgi:hypothetical protein